MLYDQGQMISLYSKAYKLFKNEYYKDLVFKTISFLNSSMSQNENLFYAAMDADTDGEEGKYYSFNIDELKEPMKSLMECLKKLSIHVEELIEFLEEKKDVIDKTFNL